MCTKSILWKVIVVLGLLMIPKASFAQVENLVPDGNFEVDQPIPGGSFGIWAPAAGEGSQAVIDFADSIDGKGCLRIDPQGTANWHFYVNIKPIVCEKDETYTLSFWAKAAEERSILLLLKGADNETPNFCEITADLGTEWAEYSVTGVNPHDVDLKLDIAAGGTISVWLDFMNLYKGEYNADIQPAGRTEPQQEVENLIENANFEVGQAIPGPGWGTWNPAAGDGSTATINFSDSIDGSGSCRIDPKGSTNWDFYLIARPITMEVGETYTLSYWAKAAEPRSIGTQIKGNDNSGPPFCVVNPELTTEWAEYTATDVCTQPVCKLDIASGGTISVWLDFMHLYKGEYVEILPGGRKLVSEEASNPNPISGSSDAPHDAILTWIPGEKAVTNNVYLGTSFDDVNDADANSVLLVSPAQDANSYDPNSLGFATTYYWRIDGITDTGEFVKGVVWSLTTRDYIGIDDFEDYSATNQIWWTWKDGLGYVTLDNEPNYPGNGTGSAVGNDNTLSFTEETIVNSGNQSIPIFYKNNKQGFANYSETTRTFETPRDWTANGITTLTLYFHGLPFNSGNMYIKINDTKIPYVGPGDNLQNEYWIQMYIDLAAVAALGADLTNVVSLTIGIEGADAAGQIYVDDIRLLREVLEILALGADKPVIDGQIDALWDAAEAYPIDTLRNGAELESELDCSGSLQILWDAENLYVLVDIKDEAQVQDSENGWEDDRIEVFIDADGSKTMGGPGANGTDGINDYQYCFSWTPDAVPPFEHYFGDDNTEKMVGVESAAVVTDGGYRIEVKLPWSTLKGSAASAGDFFGIALAVDDDDDGGGGDSQVTALMSGGGTPHNPTLWATVRLME